MVYIDDIKALYVPFKVTKKNLVLILSILFVISNIAVSYAARTGAAGGGGTGTDME